MKKYLNKIICGDSLQIMRDIPDKSIDLVLTDPPYGIEIIKKQNKASEQIKSMSKAGGYWKKYNTKEWDNKIPSKKYFDEIFRVSKNQIIWGGNYFVEYLNNSKCWLIWYKGKVLSLPDAELAWTSFNKPIRLFYQSRTDAYINKIDEKEKLHPTQKPIDLIKWCVVNYSNEDDIILDPFLGSGTTVVACQNLKRNFIGIEISPEYCAIARERLRQKPLI
ncbi:MAG: DNA methyltransferase [Candidatus Beckwithbacteria bacterium]